MVLRNSVVDWVAFHNWMGFIASCYQPFDKHRHIRFHIDWGKAYAAALIHFYLQLPGLVAGNAVDGMGFLVPYHFY